MMSEKIFKTSTFIIVITVVILNLIWVNMGYGCMYWSYSKDNDWPMFKFNVGRTGSSHDIEFNNIQMLWRYEFEDMERGGEARISPAIATDRVLVSSRNYISCLNTIDGNLVWRKYIGENYSSPIIYKGVVIISSVNSIHAFDIKDGSYVWSKSLARESEYVSAGVSVPAVLNNRVYYGFRGRDDSEGYLFCIDFLDGTTLWSYKVDGPVRTSPLAVDNMIIFGSDDGNIYCVDAGSGTYIWKYSTGDKIRSSAAVEDGKVFFGSDDYYIYCLNISNGELLWKYKTGDAVSATPAIYKGKLFVASSDRNIYCIEASKGKLIWRYSTGASSYTSPTICKNKVLIGLENELHCLLADDGSHIFSHKLADYGTSTPLAIHNARLYFRTANFVYCFALK